MLFAGRFTPHKDLCAPQQSGIGNLRITMSDATDERDISQI